MTCPGCGTEVEKSKAALWARHIEDHAPIEWQEEDE